MDRIYAFTEANTSSQKVEIEYTLHFVTDLHAFLEFRELEPPPFPRSLKKLFKLSSLLHPRTFSFQPQLQLLHHNATSKHSTIFEQTSHPHSHSTSLPPQPEFDLTCQLEFQHRYNLANQSL